MKKIYSVCLFVFLFSSIAQANPLEALFNDAKLAFDRKDFKTAIILFEKSISLYPKLPQAYYFLALSYKNDGADVLKVKLILEQAIAIRPDYAPAYDNLSKIYYGMADFQKAKEYALKAIKYNPNLSSARLTLAWAYLIGDEDPYKAIDHFKDVADKHNFAFAYFGLGIAYIMDSGNLLYLDAITGLRNLESDVLAEELEHIAQSGDYESTLRRLSPKGTVTNFKEELHITEHDYMQDATMKVRLRNQSASTQNVNADRQIPQEPSLTPVERVRELRRRSISSGYENIDGSTY